MPKQPTTLFASHSQQAPFTLSGSPEVWHVAFPDHRCELDIHGSRIEAQAFARCYYSLFLRPRAPFGASEMSECARLDLAECEAAIEIEVQQRHMEAFLYGPGGDGAPGYPHVEEPTARYCAGRVSPRHVGTPPGPPRSQLGALLSAIQSATHPPSYQVHEAGDTYGHGPDRGDGRDARGRFVTGSPVARRCGRAGFEKVVYEILPQRYPDAVNASGVHMAFNFMGWLRNQDRA